MLFATVCAMVALVRFAGSFAVETSRLRQLDAVLLPVLTVVCAVVVMAMLLLSFWKKTSGRYAPYGLVLWGMAMLLYGLITPYRIMKVLYAPAIQNLMLKVDLHIDVTTIQSVKTIAEALNLVACAVCVLLGAAVVISLIRRLCIQGAQGNALPACLAVWAAFTVGYAAFNPIVQRWGYSALFCTAAFFILFVGVVSGILQFYSNRCNQATVTAGAGMDN